MVSKSKREGFEKEKIPSQAFRLNNKVIGLSLGLIFGLSLFLATNWLVIKGGDRVGPHLSLLSQYLIGYRVSFFGSLVGFIYGFALGTLIGGLIGWIQSTIARFR